jgi:hypothetical protein
MAESQPALFLHNHFESGQATTGSVLSVAGGLPEVIVATTGGSSTYYVQVGGQILAQFLGKGQRINSR